MEQKHTPLKLMIAGALAAAAFAVAGSPASACDGCLTTSTSSTSTSTSSTSTSTSSTTATSATRQMIQEACQRTKARFAKFLKDGTPERFGSEEPFTFDPNVPCS
jgi:hypothetical protein